MRLLNMMPTISKSVAICVLWSTVLVVGGSAYAQQSGSSPLSPTDFTAHFESWDGSSWAQMSSAQQQYFFSRARCECDRDPKAEVKIVIVPGASTPAKIANNLSNSLTATGGNGRLYAGNASINCLMPSAYNSGLDASCTNLYVPDPNGSPSFDGWSTSFPMTIFETSSSFTSNPIPVAWLYNSFAFPTCGYASTCDSTRMCGTTSVALPILFWAQTVDSTNPDITDNSTALLSASLVGMVPYAPAAVTVEGGNQALNVSWTWFSGINPAADSNFLGVQIFCQRGTDSPVFADGLFSPAYMTAAMLCPDTAPATSSYGGAFSQLDPKYLCSGLIPPTANSYSIKGLQNESSYGVGVAAIDKFGNISAISPADVVYATPIAGTGGTGSPSTGGGGGAAGGPDAEATWGALGSGGAAGGSSAEGTAGSSNAGAGVRLASGCSCDVRGRHGRTETAGFLCLAVVAFALVRRKRLYPGAPKR